MGVFDGHVSADLAAADQPDQGLVHGLATDGAAGGDGVGDLGRVAGADQVADGVRHQHQLHRQGPAAALLRDQLLGQHRLERHGELEADLGLGVRGEHLDDAVDGVGGGAGVEGAEDQVARLGGGNGRLDGVPVAHLADEDHVGVLTQAGPQALGKAGGVLPHLPLVDGALVRLVDILHRVLQRDDVGVLGVVDLVDQGRQRGGFTGAGLARDQDDALVQLGQVQHRRRQTEIVQLRDFLPQQTQRQGGHPLLFEQMDAAAVVREGVRGVQLPHLHEFVKLCPGQEPGHVETVAFRQRRLVHIDHLPVLPVFGRQPANQMHIAGPVGLGLGDKFFNAQHSCYLI